MDNAAAQPRAPRRRAADARSNGRKKRPPADSGESPQVPASPAPEPAGVLPRRRRTDRHLPFETTLAVTIALISALGGVVTWRADVWGALASHADREGIVNQLAVQSARERAYTETLQEGRAFRVYVDAVLRASTESGAPATRRADVTLEDLSTAYFDQGAVRFAHSPADATYDVTKRANDLFREAQVPDESSELFADARDRHARRSVMLDLDVVLAFGLGLAALGQISIDIRRRRVGLIGALTTLVGTSVALVAVNL